MLLCSFAFLTLLPGCHTVAQPREHVVNPVTIAFAALSRNGDGSSLAIVVLQNSSDTDCRTTTVSVRDSETHEPVVADLLKHSGGHNISAGCWENLVLQIHDHDKGARSLEVCVDFQFNGSDYSATHRITEDDIWARQVVDADLKHLYVYAESDADLTNADVLDCSLNGSTVEVSDVSSLKLADGRSLVAAEIDLGDRFKPGNRIFARLQLSDGRCFGGLTKLFHPFAVGCTQYELVVRPVRVRHEEESTTITLYNEADFRKSPALLQKVWLDGEDVTKRTVFPKDALPPDLHHYERDVRDLVVHFPRGADSERHCYQIDFTRQPPLRDEPTPAGYFDVQSFHFETQRGVPCSIGGWGLRSGACIFYGGLRPRPELQEIIKSCAEIGEVAPSIPVFACCGNGTTISTLRQLAACGDFLITGKPYTEEAVAAGRSENYFRSFDQLSSLSVPWTAAVLSDNFMGYTSPDDLRWQAWACLAMGSHGLLLTPPEKGDEEMIANCRREALAVLADVQKLSPLLGVAYHVPFSIESKQRGILVEGVVCGSDNLLLCAFNEWSSRAAIQGHEPFMGATRRNVQVNISLGKDWKTISVVDALSGEKIPWEETATHVLSISLPDFNNIQPIMISRGQHDATPPSTREKGFSPAYQFESSPAVNLGTIRTSSEHDVTVSLKSLFDKELHFHAEDASHDNSRSGSFVTRQFTLPPGDSTALSIAYTAPTTIGDSVTHIRFDCRELPANSFHVYICGNVQKPATVSPALVDFGQTPVCSNSEVRRVNVSSENETARIFKVHARSPLARDVQPAPDGHSFAFRVVPTELGHFSFAIDVDILDEGDREPTRCAVMVQGDACKSVIGSPSQTSLVLRDKPRDYVLRVRHIADEPIQIESLSHDGTIRSRVKSKGFQARHDIALTITCEFARATHSTVTIRGKTKSQVEFSLAVPVLFLALGRSLEDLQ